MIDKLTSLDADFLRWVIGNHPDQAVKDRARALLGEGGTKSSGGFGDRVIISVQRASTKEPSPCPNSPA